MQKILRITLVVCMMILTAFTASTESKAATNGNIQEAERQYKREAPSIELFANQTKGISKKITLKDHVRVFYKKQAKNAAPMINVEVHEADTTAVSKKIQFAVTDANGIREQKWAYGDHDESYFANKGSRISSLQNANQKDKIIALKNGVYTIYAEDKLGNKTVKKVTIEGIKAFTEVEEEGVQCEICRMDLHKTDPQKVYSTKAVDDEGYTHYFCRVGCLYHQEHTNGVAFAEKYSRDYGAAKPRLNNWIPIENAVTVKFKEGETARGVMGWKLFHFNDLTSAANYLETTNDKVVVEKLENIREYTKTNHKGMNYEYEIDKATK